MLIALCCWLLAAWAEPPALPDGVSWDDVRSLYPYVRQLQSEERLEEAIPLMRRVLELAEVELGAGDLQVANGKTLLGQFLFDVGRHAEAEPLFLEALATRRDQLEAPHPDIERAMSSLGWSTMYLGDYVASLEWFEASLAMKRERLGERHPDLLEALSLVAESHKGLGGIHEAFDVASERISIADEHFGPNSVPAATARVSLSHVMSAQRDYPAAVDILERTLPILRAHLGDAHPDVQEASMAHVAALANAGRLEEAGPLLREWVDRARAANEPYGLAIALKNLGAHYLLDGRAADAVALFEEALAIRRARLPPDHPAIALSLDALGRALVELGELDRAQAMVTEALEIRKARLGPLHRDVAATLIPLIEIAGKRGDLHAGRALGEEALRIDRLHLDLQGQLEDRSALEFAKHTRRGLDNWVSVHRRPEDTERVWNTLMVFKGAATRRVRERRQLATPEAMALQERLAELRRDIASSVFGQEAPDKAELAGWLDQKSETERALARHGALWGEDRAREADGIAGLCAALEDGDAVVDFYRREGTREGLNVYRVFTTVAPGCTLNRLLLKDAAGIEEAIAEWRDLLADPSAPTTRVNRRGMRVRSALWEPIVATLDGAERLFVIPDGRTAILPFAALPEPDGSYLIERWPVAYLQSALDLARPASEWLGTGIQLVGDVDFATATADASVSEVATRAAPCIDGDFEALPGTLAEVDLIADHWTRGRFRKEPLTRHRGAAATEETVGAGMQGSRVVHLATHGFFATDACRERLASGAVHLNPMLLSGVALAGGSSRSGDGGWDGIMTAEEVSSLDLRGTQLVVLSACETGLGEVQSGEGVLGLRRALSAAGAEAMVMSLWAVPDQATARLMDTFYGQYLKRRRALSPPDALQVAQLALLEENRETYGEARPGTWAAFSAVGRGAFRARGE